MSSGTGQTEKNSVRAMSSELPLKADIAQHSRHASKVPPDIPAIRPLPELAHPRGLPANCPSKPAIRCIRGRGLEIRAMAASGQDRIERRLAAILAADV